MSTVIHTLCMDFPFGHCSRLISPHTQYYFSCWVFLPFLLSLYPKHFISLGISFTFLSSVPKTFHLFGYFLHFSLLCTQNISSLWVFPSLSSPLYPILFFLLGIPVGFFSLYPKCHDSCAYNGIPSFSFPAHPHKKNPALRDFPPAAGRFNDIIPLRRSVLLPGGLYCFV